MTVMKCDSDAFPREQDGENLGVILSVECFQLSKCLEVEGCIQMRRYFRVRSLCFATTPSESFNEADAFLSFLISLMVSQL